MLAVVDESVIDDVEQFGKFSNIQQSLQQVKLQSLGLQLWQKDS